jgi:hypothetical protein
MHINTTTLIHLGRYVLCGVANAQGNKILAKSEWGGRGPKAIVPSGCIEEVERYLLKFPERY